MKNPGSLSLGAMDIWGLNNSVAGCSVASLVSVHEVPVARPESARSGVSLTIARCPRGGGRGQDCPPSPVHLMDAHTEGMDTGAPARRWVCVDMPQSGPLMSPSLATTFQVRPEGRAMPKATGQGWPEAHQDLSVASLSAEHRGLQGTTGWAEARGQRGG